MSIEYIHKLSLFLSMINPGGYDFSMSVPHFDIFRKNFKTAYDQLFNVIRYISPLLNVHSFHYLMTFTAKSTTN